MEKENKRIVAVDLDELIAGVVKMTKAIRGEDDPVAQMAITDALKSEFGKMNDKEATNFLATSMVLAEVITELPVFDLLVSKLKN